MGCGISLTSSSRNSKNITPLYEVNGDIRGETIIEAYQRLDEEICASEGKCPGPRLATVEAWIEHLQEKMTEMSSSTEHERDMNQTVELLFQNVEKKKDSENNDMAKVRRLASQLGVAVDIEKAIQNEDFLATVSRNSLETMKQHFFLEIIEHAKTRMKMLLESYDTLCELYVEQDGLIASVNGGIYSTVGEEILDGQLEKAREVRDRLGGVMEQWRTSASLLRASAKSALHGFELWTLVKKSIVNKERIQLALDCRQAIQASLIAFEAATLSLPQVEIKHVTKRQSLAVNHANVYLLTDIADDVRYSHITRVFDAYQTSLSNAIAWLHETFQKTLRRDFDNAENGVLDLAKKLRQERIEIITGKVGPKMYGKKLPQIDPG